MVKPGYKETEVGVIPEDWEVFQFGTKVQIFRGGSPRPIQDYLTQSEDGINWIKIGDVREGDKYITSTQEKIIPQGISRSREVHVGDFILSNSMSFGRPYILNINGCIHDGWLTIQSYQDTFNKEYLYYLLSSDFVYQQYVSMAAGSSVQNLNKEKVANLVTLCPSLEEQQKIAEALSDMDELIASLEQLIDKKKAVKQGAMQELLTGKKRLPGFDGEWEKRELGDLCKIVNGATPSTTVDQYWNGNILWCTPTDITRCTSKYLYDTQDKITPAGLAASSAQLLPKGTLLLCSRATIGEVCIAGTSICTNQGFKSLIVNSNINNEWLYYMIAILKPKMREKAIGSTFLEISKKDLSCLSMLVPSVEEQQAITSILSDMDAEIEALEQKLAKCRQTKQGMMQQLLTGKIRFM